MYNKDIHKENSYVNNFQQKSCPCQKFKMLIIKITETEK